MSNHNQLEIMGVVIGLSGIVILVASAGWPVALGVFLCAIGNNMERTARTLGILQRLDKTLKEMRRAK